MSPEWISKLRPLYLKVERDLMRVAQASSFGEAIREIRKRAAQEGPHFAPWLHHRARREYVALKKDTIDPTQFDSILALIEVEGQFFSLIQDMPDQAGPVIESFLRFIHRDHLPKAKESYGSLAKRLPRRPAGGRPPVTTEKKDKAEICRQLLKLDEAHVPRGKAQERMAERFGKSVREIQRIWKDCKENRSLDSDKI